MIENNKEVYDKKGEGFQSNLLSSETDIENYVVNWVSGNAPCNQSSSFFLNHRFIFRIRNV